MAGQSKTALSRSGYTIFFEKCRPFEPIYRAGLSDRLSFRREYRFGSHLAVSKLFPCCFLAGLLLPSEGNQQADSNKPATNQQADCEKPATLPGIICLLLPEFRSFCRAPLIFAIQAMFGCDVQAPAYEVINVKGGVSIIPDQRIQGIRRDTFDRTIHTRIRFPVWQIMIINKQSHVRNSRSGY